MSNKDKEANLAQVGVIYSEPDKSSYSNPWADRLLEWGVEARGKHAY